MTKKPVNNQDLTPPSMKQHELAAEWVNDEHGPAVLLRQSDDGYCEPQTILVHPWQLRATCEHFGILPTGDKYTRQLVAMLGNRLGVLAKRIGELRHYMATCSDHEHADLVAEMTMLNALGDLADCWAEDVPAQQALANAKTSQSPNENQSKQLELSDAGN